MNSLFYFESTLSNSFLSWLQAIHLTFLDELENCRTRKVEEIKKKKETQREKIVHFRFHIINK